LALGAYAASFDPADQDEVGRVGSSPLEPIPNYGMKCNGANRKLASLRLIYFAKSFFADFTIYKVLGYAKQPPCELARTHLCRE
jgi:hypothetical protein